MALLQAASTITTTFPEIGTTRDSCTLKFEITEARCGSISQVVPQGFVDAHHPAAETYEALARTGQSFLVLEVSYTSPCALSGFQFNLDSLKQLPSGCGDVMAVLGGITTAAGSQGAANANGFWLYETNNQIVGHFNPVSQGTKEYLPVATTPTVLCYIVIGGPRCKDFWNDARCREDSFSIRGSKGAVNVGVDGKSTLTEHLETWSPNVVAPFPGAPSPSEAAFYRIAQFMANAQYKENWDANGKDGENQDRTIDIIDLVAYVNDRFNAYNKIRSKEIVPSYCCEDSLDCEGDLKILCVECFPSSERKQREAERERLGPCHGFTKGQQASAGFSLASGINFNNADGGFNSPQIFSDKPLEIAETLEPQDMVITVAYRSSMPVSGIQFDVGYNAFGNRGCGDSGKVELHKGIRDKWVGQSTSIEDRFGYDKVTRVLAYQFPKEQTVREFAKKAGSTKELTKLFLASSLPASGVYQGVLSFVIQGCVPIGCPCPERYYVYAEEMPNESKDEWNLKHPTEAQKGDEYVGPVVLHEGEWYTSDSSGSWLPSSRLLESKWTNMELINSRLVSNFIRKELEHQQQRLKYSGEELTVKAEIPATYSSYAEYFDDIINDRYAQKALYNGLNSNPDFSTYEAMTLRTEPDLKGYDLDANLDGKFDVADLLALINLATLRMIFPFKTEEAGVPDDAATGADATTGRADTALEASSQYRVTAQSDTTNILDRLLREARIVPVYVCLDELCTCTLPDVCPDICDDDYDGALLNFSDRLDIPKNNGAIAGWTTATSEFWNSATVAALAYKPQFTIVSATGAKRTFTISRGPEDSIDLTGGTIVPSAIPSNANITAITKSGNSNTAAEITTANAHGLSVGVIIGITGVVGSDTGANGFGSINTTTGLGQAYEVASVPASNELTLKPFALNQADTADTIYVNNTAAGTYSSGGTIYHYFPSGTRLADGTTLLRLPPNANRLHWVQELKKAILAPAGGTLGDHSGRGSIRNSAGVVSAGFGKPQTGALTVLSAALPTLDNQTITITAPSTAASQLTKIYKLTDDAGEGATGTAHSDGTSIVVQLNGLSTTATIATQIQVAINSFLGHNGAIKASNPVAGGGGSYIVPLTQTMASPGATASPVCTTPANRLAAITFSGGGSEFIAGTSTTPAPETLSLQNFYLGEKGNTTVVYDDNFITWAKVLFRRQSSEFTGGRTYLSTLPDTFKDWSRYFYDIHGITPQKLYDPRRLRHNGVSFFKVQLCANSSDVHFVRDAIFTIDFCNTYSNIATAFQTINSTTGAVVRSSAKFYGYAGEGFEDLEYFDSNTGAKLLAGTDGLYPIPLHGKVSVLVHNKGDEDFFERNKYQFDEHPSTAITHDGGQLTLARMFVTPLPDFAQNKSISLLSGKNQKIGETYGSITYRKRPRGTFNPTSGQYTSDDDVIWTTVKGENGWLAVGPNSSFYSQFYDDNSASLHTYADYMLHVMAVGPRTVDIIYNSSKPFDRAVVPIGTWNGAEVEEVVDGFGIKSSTHYGWDSQIYLNSDSATASTGSPLDASRWGEDGYSIVRIDPSVSKYTSPMQLSGSGVLCRLKFNKAVFEPLILRSAPKNFICPPIGTPNNLIIPDLSVQRKGDKDYPTGRNKEEEEKLVERDKEVQKHGDNDNSSMHTVKSGGAVSEADGSVILHLDAATTNHYSYLTPVGSYTGNTDSNLDVWHGNPGPVFVSFGNTFVPMSVADNDHKPKVLGATKTTNRFGSAGVTAGLIAGATNSVVSFNTGVNTTGAGLFAFDASLSGGTVPACDMARGTAAFVFSVEDTTWDDSTNNRGVIAIASDTSAGFAWSLEVIHSTTPWFIFSMTGWETVGSAVTAVCRGNTTTAQLAKANLITLQWDCYAQTMAMYLNGSLMGTADALGIHPDFTKIVPNWSIGYDHTLDSNSGPKSAANTSNQGNTTASNATLQMQLAEAIVISGKGATDSERQKAEAYYASKWGCTNNLPSTHPGYNTSQQLTDTTQDSWNNNFVTHQEVDSESREALEKLRIFVDESAPRLDSDRCAAKWVSERVWIDKSNEFLLRLKPSSSI